MHWIVPAFPLTALVLFASLPSRGETARRSAGTCVGCLVSPPAEAGTAPLLVLLHGDGESAKSVFDAWQAAASRRGIVAFAPQCPLSEGCGSQSWWKWNGEPGWLLRQVAALRDLRTIDRERMWIVGWSGGATYLGWRTQAFERDFAALVLHGGGARPSLQTCSSPRSSIYFLGGDKNPLHALAEGLHGYYLSTCPHEDVSWTVLPGVDHEGERRALAAFREPILDWLSTRRRASREVADSDESHDSLPAPSGSELPPLRPTAPARSPVPSSLWRCATDHAPKTSSTAILASAGLALGAGLRRRHRARRSTPFTR